MVLAYKNYRVAINIHVDEEDKKSLYEIWRRTVRLRTTQIITKNKLATYKNS